MNTDRPTTPNEACTHQTRHLHGTYTSYKTCGCRCDDCKQAQSRYQADYKRPAPSRRGERLEPRSPEWVAAMRRGLLTAVVESFERDGRNTFI